jgi:membrane peptidoglycan carboxypeptidase
MVDLVPAHLDYGQRHMRHIGSLPSQDVCARLRAVAPPVAYPRQVVRAPRAPRAPSASGPIPRRRGLWLGAGVIRFLLFLGVAATAGVLVAGLLLPLVGGAGLAARSAADSFDNLPEALSKPVLAQQSRIITADGSTLATFYTQNRINVTLDQISPKLQRAIVAIEDARFYEHKGIDVKGLLRAYVTNQQAGQTKQGGSTITQQYVKQVLLLTASTDAQRKAATADNYGRKLREAKLAIGLEKRWDKKSILENYLNICFFGDKAYGAEAASESYFGVHAANLTLAQAATLAGLVQQPVRLNPINYPAAAQERRNIVLDKMLEQKLITQAQHDQAKAIPMSRELRPKQISNGCATSYAPFFCDYVIQIIKNDPAFGATASDRQALLDRGGLTIRTTLDPALQHITQKAVDDAIPPKDPSRKMAAAVVEQPGTGAILAMAQDRVWGLNSKVLGETSINYMVDTKYNGTDYGIAAGSTFKPFTMAAALEKHLSINTQINATSPKTFTHFRNCTTGALYPPYSPRNSTSSGLMNMAKAAAYSVNTYFVGLEEKTGQCLPAQIATELGIKGPDGKPIENPGPSFTLGTYETTPLDMAEAYATFAARGVHCASRSILSITDRNGATIAVPPKTCEQALTPAVADGVNYLLHGVIYGPYPNPTGGPMRLASNRPAGGKTGTIDDHAAVWFAGYTPQLATAVWVGDQRSGFKYPMYNVTINGVHYSEVFGKSIPGPIWKTVMDAALKGKPFEDFVPPDPKVIHGIQVKIPDLTNMTPADAEKALQARGLGWVISPTKVNVDAVQYGHVAKTNPAAGASIGIGSEVAIYLSTGRPPPGTGPSSSPGSSGSPSPGTTPTPNPTPSATPSTSGATPSP